MSSFPKHIHVVCIVVYYTCMYIAAHPPQAINRGIDAVRKIVEEKQLSGVYGPLIVTSEQ